MSATIKVNPAIDNARREIWNAITTTLQRTFCGMLERIL
jgi:hypothetical protein